MAFRLVVTEGPLKGRDFLVKESIIIGRKQGDLLLPDTKASSIHAKISCDNSGLIEIEDLSSVNGTLVNGTKISRTRLKAGDEIGIGTSCFILKAVVPRQKDMDQMGLGTWQNDLDTALAKALQKAEKLAPATTQILPFNPPLVLEFVGGQQTGQKIVFGYGPRQVGAFCSDALLHEVGTPPVAFEVRPAKDSLCEFKTKESSILLNDTPVKSAKLKNGDRLSVGRTVIVVKALENL